MTRRAPTFSDAQAMVGLLRWAHENSVYAEQGLTFDEREANRLLCVSIQRNGYQTSTAFYAQVAERQDEIVGLIVGVVQPVYQCHKELGASDLWWISKPRCPARDKVGLMFGFVEWAKAHKKVREISSAPNDVMGGGDKATRILEALGFHRSGGIFRMEVTH